MPPQPMFLTEAMWNALKERVENLELIVTGSEAANRRESVDRSITRLRSDLTHLEDAVASLRWDLDKVKP